MKINYIKILALVAVLFTQGCTNKDSYDYNAIIPKVLNGVQGPVEVVQTFTATYTTSYVRGGSKWNWTVNDATIQSISEDTRTVVVEFKNLPADGKATVSVSETTHGGITSEIVSKEILVKPYCALTNGNNDLVGSWSGDDFGYESTITTEIVNNKLAVSGMNSGFISDWWGETIVAGGTFNITINPDGTLDIPKQAIFTTEYDGARYDYDIKGSGTWDNCGDSPVLNIKYDIYYTDGSLGGKGLAEKYASNFPTPYMTAEITLINGNKSARIIEKIVLKSRDFKK
jgi:hypothetical protein